MSSSEEDERDEAKSPKSDSKGLSDESSGSETDTSYDVEQDEEYILLSNDELLSDNSDSGVQDEDYFDSSSVEEGEESEAAWTDSDESVEPRDELDGEAAWLHTEGAPKKIRKTVRRISFKHARHVFTAKCKIKLFRVFEDFKVLVDSFNLIYLIKNFEEYKTFKVDFFKITDVCSFNGKILFSSSTSSYIKQVTPEGKVVDIKKGTGNIRKMVVDEYLYVLGDKLFAFNKNLGLACEFSQKFKDVCVACGHVVCLTEAGDIHIFDKDLNFKNKLSLAFKFQLKGVWPARDKLIVSTENGIVIFDANFREVKTFANLKEPISGLVYNDEFIVHGSPYSNSLRILKGDLTYYDRFPFSKIKINPISTISIEGDIVYFNDSRYISSLKLQYV